jgi:hypothetical protein
MIRFEPALNSAFATATASHDVHNSRDAAAANKPHRTQP